MSEDPVLYVGRTESECYEQLRKASEEALKELERVNSFLVINNEVIANLKNALI